MSVCSLVNEEASFSTVLNYISHVADGQRSRRSVKGAQFRVL